MFSTDTPRLVDQYGLPIPRDGDESQALIPHPLTFGYVLNTIAKTYSFRWDEALRHLPQNALAMRRDCFIRSLLQERKLPTANRSWQLTPDDPRDPAQRRAVQTLTRCIKQTRRWRRFLAYLLEAIWYGRYGAQITWERRPIGNGERAWCVGSHTPVNGDKIQFAWDAAPVVFINQSAAGRYPPEYVVYTDRVPGLKLARQNWRDQFIIHTHEVDDADYFEGELAGAVQGVGLRNWVYWAWWLRDEMLGWAVDFMKKVGTLGLLVFWYELGNKAAKAEAEKNAQRASKETALVMGRPGAKDTSAWGVDHVGISMTGVETLQRMIQNYFEHHIERLIIGQTLSAGVEGHGLGGTGVARLHENTKFQLLQFDADNLAETLTDDLVGPLLRKNFPDAEFGVRFEFNVEAPDNDSKMKTVQSAAALGVTFRMDEVRELTGMSKPAEGEETVGAAAKKREAREHDDANDDAGADDQAGDSPSLYVKNPEFEAKHPRTRDGKFGRKDGSEWTEFTSAAMAMNAEPEGPFPVKDRQKAQENLCSGVPPLSGVTDAPGPDVTKWLARDFIWHLRFRLEQQTTALSALEDISSFARQAADKLSYKWIDFGGPDAGKGVNTVVVGDYVLRKNQLGNMGVRVIGTLFPPRGTPLQFGSNIPEIGGFAQLADKFPGANDVKARLDADKIKIDSNIDRVALLAYMAANPSIGLTPDVVGGFDGRVYRADNLAAMGIGRLIAWKFFEGLRSKTYERIVKEANGNKDKIAAEIAKPDVAKTIHDEREDFLKRHLSGDLQLHEGSRDFYAIQELMIRTLEDLFRGPGKAELPKAAEAFGKFIPVANAPTIRLDAFTFTPDFNGFNTLSLKPTKKPEFSAKWTSIGAESQIHRRFVEEKGVRPYPEYEKWRIEKFQKWIEKAGWNVLPK